jgi:hypothetical protein
MVMVSNRMSGGAPADVAGDADLQAAIDAFISPRGASAATDDNALGTAEDWQRHYDDTPYPPDHPGSDERMAATDRYLAEEWRRLQREKLERTATYAAAAVVTANDPVVVAEEAATLDACLQAMMGASDVRPIDRSMVTVSHYFARDVPLFFVAQPNIVMLAHPKGKYGASPKWAWVGGVRCNQFLSICGDPEYFFVAHAYRCSLPGYKKLWAIKRNRYRHGKTDDAYHVDLLALSPWPLFFTEVTAAKIVAQLCAPEATANKYFCWVPFAKDIGSLTNRFDGET